MTAKKKQSESPTATTLTERLDALRTEHTQLVARRGALLAQRTEAVIHDQPIDDLTAELHRVEEQLGVLDGAIEKIGATLPQMREAEGRKAAEARLLGIRRAHGSLVAQHEDDLRRYSEAVAALHDAVARINERFKTLTLLRAEAGALADRFALPGPQLTAISPPAMRKLPMPVARFSDSGFVRPQSEMDEHRFFTRRTYREIVGSEGFKIIEAAGGPKAWPALSSKQRATVDQRARAKEAEDASMARFGPEAEKANFSQRALHGIR